MSIVDDLRQGHVKILEAIEGLSELEMTKENAIGKWSVKDILLHISLWDGECIKAFAVWRTGHDYDWAYADEYLKLNECWHTITKNLSLNQALQSFNLNRNALISDVALISDDIWQKRGGIPKWLTGIAMTHNNWHLEKIETYRKSLGK